MAEYTIANGETEKVISNQEAREIAEMDKVIGFAISIDGGQVRIAPKHQRQYIKQALPLAHNDLLTGFDPNDLEWYVFNDAASGSVTVTVVKQYFRLADVAGV